MANDDHDLLAAVVRREGESLFELLVRLDDAIEKARDGECVIDEIND